jgi:hypothetical protein
LKLRLNSISNLPERDTFFTAKITSKLILRFDSLQQKASALRRKADTAKKLYSLQHDIIQKVSNAQNEINEKLSGFEQNGMIDLPTDLTLPLPFAPPLSGDIGNIKIPSNILGNATLGNATLPDANLPSPDLSTKPFQLPSIQERLPTG